MEYIFIWIILHVAKVNEKAHGVLFIFENNHLVTVYKVHLKKVTLARIRKNTLQYKDDNKWKILAKHVWYMTNPY